MSTAAYALTFHDSVLTDEQALDVLWFHDLPRDIEKLHAQALVASGDYFEMLAAALEQVAVVLPLDSVEQYQMQHYIGQLLYLQHHYKIIKK
jgi:hypothetical protein